MDSQEHLVIPSSSSASGSECCCNSDAASSDADDEEDPTTDLTVSSTLIGSTYTATCRTASVATGDYSLASTIGAGYEMIALQQLAPPLQSPSTPDLLLYGHTHANGHAFATQQNEANAAAEAEAAIHDSVTHTTAASALNTSTYSNGSGGGGGLDCKRPIPPAQLFPNGSGLQTQLPPPPQPSSAGVMGNVNGGTLVNGYTDDPTPHTPLNNPLDGRMRHPPLPPGGTDPSGRDEPPLCRLMPSSMAVKLNKLSVRSGLYKVVGEFGLRENLYYGSIFLCMTLIVIVCFLVINNRANGDAGTASAMFDGDDQCEHLLDPGNGEVHQTGRYLGDRAIYTCSAGWEIVGPEERVCQADGDWSNNEPYCKKRVYCLDPPIVQHATHNGAPDTLTFTLETVLKYSCYPGYLTVGFAHAKCFLYNDTAQWFGPDVTCKAIRCSEPEEISNGDVDRKCQTFGCRISYACRPGYELVGREHRYCQADGSWSPRILPECVPIQCELPRNPANGRAVYASVSYNSLISYECNYGYMLIGDSVRRCEKDKQWTGAEPHCKEINCGSPGILPNGWLEGTRTTLHAVVTFRCQEGMTFEGPSYRTICQADGRWSHPLPRCYAPCVVPHVSHGFVRDRASGASVPHSQTIDVQCLSQFQKTHNSTPVCKNGTWSRIPKCVPAKCTELPEAPQNGMVVAPRLDHGMIGKFECRDGYMLKGHNTTQCFFGNWTGMTPWCKEVFCPFPGFVENGKVLLVGSMGLYEYRPYVRKIRNNRQIMYQCTRGYILVGGPTGATCIDGQWSPPQSPKCEEEAHPKARVGRVDPGAGGGSDVKVLVMDEKRKRRKRRSRRRRRRSVFNDNGDHLSLNTWMMMLTSEG